MTSLFEIATLLVEQNSNNSGGTLITGFCVAYITMFISSISITRTKKIKSKFVFPINRKIYTIGNFIVFFINTFILLLISCSAYLLEIIISVMIKSVFKNFIYINTVTFESYSLGFIISLLYIVALTSLTYLLSIIFSNYGIKGITFFALTIIILFMFQFGRNILFGIMMFFIGEQSVLLLALKLIVCALVLHSLSYLPIKNMEVNQ